MQGFLDRVSGLFDKGFFLGALFPVLATAILVSAGGALIVGFRASFRWFESLSPGHQTILVVLGAVVLLLSASVLRSLRLGIIGAWRGTGMPEWLVVRQKKKREKLRHNVDRMVIWEQALNYSKDRSSRMEKAIIKSRRKKSTGEADAKRICAIVGTLKIQTADDGLDKIIKCVASVVIKLAQSYRAYDGELVKPIYTGLSDFLKGQMSKEVNLQQTARSELDLEFGSADGCAQQNLEIDYLAWTITLTRDTRKLRLVYFGLISNTS